MIELNDKIPQKQFEMKTKCAFFLLFIIFICISSCKKATVIEPPNCFITFKLQFIDKNNGEDLAILASNFIDSLKITNFVNEGNGYLTPGKTMFLNSKLETDKVYIKFIASSFYYCKKSENSKIQEDKYIIEYSDKFSNDSILIRLDNSPNAILFSCYLNDSLIDDFSIDDFKSSSLYLPTLQIKK